LGDRLAGDGIEISLAWRLPLAGTDPSRFDVGVARDGGSFRRVDLARPTSRRASMGALIGPEYLVRLRARTRDGAAGEYAESTFHLAAIEDSSSVIRATKGWTVARHPAYSGTARYATKAGATLSLAFDGTGIAVLGPVGPGRGGADVRVDGERVARIDARARTFRPHELLAAVDGLAAGPHVLSVTVAGTPGRPMVAVDRFVVLSQP